MSSIKELHVKFSLFKQRSLFKTEKEEKKVQSLRVISRLRG